MLNAEIETGAELVGGIAESRLRSEISFPVDVLKGEKGDKGDKGDRGERGPQGIQGVQGPQGERGPKGDTGERGADSTVPGPQGPKGDTGPQGQRGEAFTYDMFTPSQLAALVGPQGPQGVQGPRGERGERGETGPQGIQGPKGADGKMSFEDLTPEQRESLRGPQGIQGPQGPQGPKGDDSTVPGPQGPQGPQGPKGDSIKGDTGPQGPQGIKGDTPVITATKSGKVTTVYSDGVEIAMLNDGADGAGAVTDVQVSGKSILVDGVANIQLHTGLKANANNVIYLPDPNATQINGRAYNVALTLQTLDNGVKAAMCDGKGAAWSDDEKAAARARMGVADAVTDDHINGLIDAKLGVIENGTY